MSTVLSGSAQPGAAAGLYSHSSQPYIQRLGIAGVSIQRLQAVPTPCRPLERAVPVPCQRAGIAAQARARGRAVLGTGTGEAGRAVFVPGQISIVPVLARWAWPVWKSLVISMLPHVRLCSVASFCIHASICSCPPTNVRHTLVACNRTSDECSCRDRDWGIISCQSFGS